MGTSQYPPRVLKEARNIHIYRSKIPWSNFCGNCTEYKNYVSSKNVSLGVNEGLVDSLIVILGMNWMDAEKEFKYYINLMDECQKEDSEFIYI